jgi:hypothetical protein
MSVKNSSDTIGNRTRDVPVCSAVPQPTAPSNTKLDLKNVITQQIFLFVAVRTFRLIKSSTELSSMTSFVSFFDDPNFLCQFVYNVADFGKQFIILLLLYLPPVLMTII